MRVTLGLAEVRLHRLQNTYHMEGRAACQNTDTGTNQRIIALHSVQRAKTEMSAKHIAWLGSSPHRTAGQSGIRKGRSLKRPNLLKTGRAGQLEDMSVKDQTLCSEVFLSLVHDSFSKLNRGENYSQISTRHGVYCDCNLDRGEINQCLFSPS